MWKPATTGRRELNPLMTGATWPIVSLLVSVAILSIATVVLFVAIALFCRSSIPLGYEPLAGDDNLGDEIHQGTECIESENKENC